MTNYTFFYWVEMLLKEGKALFVVSACLTVFFYLKKTIIALMNRLNSVKFGTAEFNFKEETHVIKTSIEAMKDIPSKEANFLLPQVAYNFEIFELVACIQPNVAVLSAWRELELTALTLASKYEVEIIGTSLGRASGIAAIKNVQAKVNVEDDIIKLYEKAGTSVKPISKGMLHCAPEDAVIFCQNAKRLSNYLSSLV